MEQILRYFPDLTESQKERLELLGRMLVEWNTKINVISRKDTEHIYTNHILHSLAIAKINSFHDGARILDVGTGGGLPGLPLAIMFPGSRFTLADSIGKKITVVKDIVEKLGLTNVKAVNGRVEDIDGKFDYVVSRAVTAMPAFIGWIWDKITPGEGNGTLPNGIIYLKGGDLDEELFQTGKSYSIYHLSDIFKEPFFETKKVVYIRKR